MKSFIYKTLLLILLSSYSSSLLPIAGRGGSYSSGSSSSSSSSNSSSSSSSSSSSWGNSDSDEEEDVYTGPYFTDQFDYVEYNTWLTIQKSGRVKVREELHLDNPDSHYLKKPFYKEYKEVKVVPKSLKVSGDVISNNNFEVELTVKEEAAKLVIFEYTIENPFFKYGNEMRFLWHSFQNGILPMGYIQVEFEGGLKPKGVKVTSGQLSSYWGYHPKERKLSPLKGKNGFYTHYLNKTQGGAADIDIRMPIGSVANPKNEKGQASFLTRSAQYQITIHKNEELSFSNTYDARVIKDKIEENGKEKFLPVLRMSTFFLVKEGREGLYPDEAKSNDIMYSPISENMDYSSSDQGFQLSERLDDKSYKEVNVKYKGVGFIEEFGEDKYVNIVLPTLGSGRRFYGNYAYTAKSEVVIELPFDPLQQKENKIGDEDNTGDTTDSKYKAYYVQKAYGNHHAYWGTLQPKIKIKNSTVTMLFNKPILGDGRILLQLQIPDNVTSPGFGDRMAYYFSFSSSASKNWFYWIVGILGFVLFCVVIMYFFLRETPVKSNWNMSNKIAVDLEKHASGRSKKIEASIQKSDPGFSMERFLVAVKLSATKLQQGWSENNMLLVRNWISQGLMNRFRLQLKMMIQIENLRNIVKDYQVRKAIPLSVESSGDYESIHVLMLEKARDITLAANLNSNVMQSKVAKASTIKFAQVYSFTRKKGAKTPKADMITGDCPSCGGSSERMGQSNICHYCSARFNSGDYDWVLNEITQLAEWKKRPSAVSHRMDEFAKFGPAQVLEDRASYLFWEWLYASSNGERQLLDRHSTANYMKIFPSQRVPYFVPVIGDVTLIGRKKIDDRFLSADLSIKWSASHARSVEPKNKNAKMRIILDTTTFPNSGFADEGCPSCGAPVWEDNAVECKFCSKKLPPVSYDWLLHKLQMT